ARSPDPVSILFAHPPDLPEPQPQGQSAIRARLQRAIPERVIDRNRAHFDTAVAGIAHELRGGVEAHGLAVQERAGEDRLMMTLQPGRYVDQPGEAGGMAFGEAIGAETLDLGKTARGEAGIIAALQHAADETVAKGTDGAHPL